MSSEGAGMWICYVMLLLVTEEPFPPVFSLYVKLTWLHIYCTDVYSSGNFGRKSEHIFSKCFTLSSNKLSLNSECNCLSATIQVKMFIASAFGHSHFISF